MQIREGVSISDDDALKYDSYKLEYEQANRTQYILKIKLNSLYGTLGNCKFKFFDIRMAESTTRTGQNILLHMCRKISELMGDGYNYPSKSITYGDTDSSYFKTYAASIEEAYNILVAVGKKVNPSFIDFNQRTFLCDKKHSNLINAAPDVISDICIFVKKKYYIMHLLYSDGVPVSQSKEMKVMGLQIKKTSIPKPISKKITGFIKEYFKVKNWDLIARSVVNYKKELLTSRNISSLGLPIAVKKLNEYTELYKLEGNKTRLPGHVAASILYNQCLEKYNDKSSFKIVQGMKIKVYHLLKQVDGKFNSIAIPSDMKELPQWFIEHYQPLIDFDAQIERLVDSPLETILSAIGEISPTEKTLVMKEVLQY